VVLVHGIWSNTTQSWVNTGFKDTLDKAGFNTSLADYRVHNAETFDPYAIPKIGNYGINSIAASQVDIVAHSMGGLMARGLTQQPDYRNQNNSMEGYIHRLITIGTPHFGGQLAKILLDHKNDWYCVNSLGVLLYPTECLANTLQQLKTIFANVYGLPIDKGGVEGLVPGSTAYMHLCRTNVTSYAIAGSWAPGASNSRLDEAVLHKNILGNPFFDLDRDGFQGNMGNNDLQVNLTSQVGGLDSQFRLPSNSTIPNQSEVYPSTVHSSLLIHGDQNVTSELHSLAIQHDTVILLGSPDYKFAKSIGVGSQCVVPRQ
jgi:hypothetical protein